MFEKGEEGKEKKFVKSKKNTCEGQREINSQSNKVKHTTRQVIILKKEFHNKSELHIHIFGMT
jgi:hypothetical protein